MDASMSPSPPNRGHKSELKRFIEYGKVRYLKQKLKINMVQ